MGVIGDDRQLTGSVESNWYCGVMPNLAGKQSWLFTATISFQNGAPVGWSEFQDQAIPA